MIPSILIKWFGEKFAPVFFWAVVAVLVLAILGVAKCSYDQRAATEIKLGKNQTDAAQQSGHDAVNTLGNVMSNTAAGHDLTERNRDAIDKAEGSHAPVANGAIAAGVQSLCQRTSYRREHPECVQRAAP